MYMPVRFWIILAEGGIVGHVRVEYVEGRSPMDATLGQTRLLVIVKHDQLSILGQLELAN